MASTEDYVTAGLYDPAVDADTGRLDLLHWLEGLGFTIDEMVEAHGWAGLGALAGDRRLVPGERLTDDEAMAISGLDRATFEAVTTAFGFSPWATGEPEQLGLTEPEATMLATFDQMSTMFTDEEALAFFRVIGSSLARMAEAGVSIFLTDIESPHLAAQGSELVLAKKVLDANSLIDGMMAELDPALRRHVLHAIERTRLSSINEFERLQYRYAVGFVDLVGFTPLSQSMSARELSTFLREFEGRATDAVTAAGARLVKLIGDEAMFVAPDPDSACRVSQALMTTVATAAGGEVRPRGGVAYGDVLVRGGDYHGQVVNLAARLVNEAVPQELLVTEAFADATTCLVFEPAGRRMLKGFDEPVVVRSILLDG
ncbi:MAG: adenylate/guanylate cyclase domain-containing protein [Actinomycetota bacterium]